VGWHRAPHPSWPAHIPPGSVILGTTSTGKYIWLPPELRKLGLEIVGLPNQGKSKLMEAMAWQDVIALCGTDRSVIFADPHKGSAAALFNKAVTYGIDRIKPVKYLDISDPDFIFKLGLRRREGVDPAVPAAAASDSVLKGSWHESGQSPDAQPQLTETLNIAFYTVVEFGGAFVDAAKLLELDDSTGLRRHAADHSENPLVRSFWRTVEAHRAREREILLGSARRRLVKFLLPRRTREIFSDPANCLDWREALDEGHVILLSLAYDEAGIVSEQQAVTIGTLIMSDILLACRGRGEADLTAYLFWDEVHRFATEAAARFFTEARKFKVHPVFAHQIFTQLDEAGAFVKGAIMSARNKVFFGGLPPDDAELAARFAFRGQLDFEKPKHRYDKPIQIGQELTWLLNESRAHGTSVSVGTQWSQSEGHATTRSTSYGSSTTTAEGTSESVSAAADGDGDGEETETTSSSESTSQTESYTESEAVTDSVTTTKGGSDVHTTSNSQTAGRGQAFKGIYKIMPTASFSFPELLEMAAARIAGLKQGQCIVKIGMRPAAQIRTLPVRDGWATPEHITRAKQRMVAETPYMAPVSTPKAAEPLVPRELPPPAATDDATPRLDEREATHSHTPPLKDEGWG
jgi:hypothetical protein